MRSRSRSADANDAAITASRGPNLAWLPADPARRVGKLLVFLPSGGANNLPTEFTWIGAEGARLGYHTIVLAYRNEVPINVAPPAGCGAGIDPPATPPNCARDVHRELLDGGGESPVVDIDPANGIENRLGKLLVYLKATYPEEGWSQFLDTSGPEPTARWSETAIAGQSLGAGEAFWIAKAADGVTPAPKLLASWRSILGDSDADTYLDQVDNCPLVANPDQTTNPCKTAAPGTVAGSVPATLAVTTGAAATFGAFTPGVDRTYDAAGTANVISTAGDGR